MTRITVENDEALVIEGQTVGSIAVGDPVVCLVADGDATVSVVEEKHVVAIDDGPQQSVVIGDSIVVQVAEQGPPGRDGTSSGESASYPADGAIGGHRLVSLQSDGTLRYASNDNLDDAAVVIGFSTNAAADGGDVTVSMLGPIFNAGWTWTPGLPVYLGTIGQPTQTPPDAPAAQFSIIVGAAVSADTINIRIEDPILF